MPSKITMRFFTFHRTAFLAAALWFVVLVVLATAGRHWGWLRSFGGDAMAVVFVYYGFKTVLRAPPWLLALLAVGTGYAVEAGQWLARHEAWVITQPVLRVVLGSTPDWLDGAAYTLGGVLVYGYESYKQRKPQAARTMAAGALQLLPNFSWQELRHHPWRSAAAVVAIMLGVALGFAVHVINASALSEFSSAVRTVNGQPDVELRAASGSLDEALYAQVAQHPMVALASPVLELGGYVIDAQGKKVSLKIQGIDVLVAAPIAPDLLPRVDPALPEREARYAMFAPRTVFVNAAARALVKGDQLQLITGQGVQSLRVAGQVVASGAPLAVMDIGAAQDLWHLQGQLSRIDLRLAPGASPAALREALALPASVITRAPEDNLQRISKLSRAYRVNMTVLALVALFTGAFLVFSVMSLSVAKRAQQWALLGVLGLTPRQRLQLVIAEAAILGIVGSVLGIGLGTGLAELAMQVLGGDLGGGYFAGVTPSLQWDGAAAAVYGLLGIAAAIVGAWWPAQAAQSLPLAQTLKGLGSAPSRRSALRQSLFALFLIAACAVLAWTPPLFGLPIGAFIAIALLLVGGIALLPVLVTLGYDRLAPWVATRALPLLAVERARRVRETAAVAISGVVAALSLAVALTVMVASFRGSVTQWLDNVLPAPLYVRTATGTATSQLFYFSPELVGQLGQLPGVERIIGQRNTTLQLASDQPSVALLARPLAKPASDMPMIRGPVPPDSSVPPDAVPLYVSEAVVDLYQARLGHFFELNLPIVLVSTAQAATKKIASPSYYIAGVWRDYARQFGAITIDQRDYSRITGDVWTNDLAVWLKPDADSTQVQERIRSAVANAMAGGVAGDMADAVAGDTPSSTPTTAAASSAKANAQAKIQTDAAQLAQAVEISSSAEIRRYSLNLFDRSFAVTYWLQAVAIGIGLFGVAASFSAQVLARRKEFGLLAHLGLTRRQILQVVAGEGAAWTTIGALAGCAMGLCVAAILVHVVNPQSFHWTMDMVVPWGRLSALCLAVIVAGTVTAWLAGRAAAGKDAVLAVKEDW
jgi:putative ABC transport system permease protein